jgi:hypothetical protein
MALEVSCTPVPPSDNVAHLPDGSPAVTRVHVRQTGFEESVRWRRYYDVVGYGWERALASLKSLLEK